MMRLIRASIRYYSRNKALYIALGLFAALALALPILGYWNFIKYDEVSFFEDRFFVLTPILPFVLGGLIPILVGTEYDWGTIRNKLTVGHRRSEVYFSTLLASLASAFLIFAIYTILYTALGLFILDKMTIPLKAFLMYMVASLLVTASVVSISVAISYYTSSRALSIIVTLAVLVVLIMIGNYALSSLEEPEMISNSITIVDGEMKSVDPYPNPRYIPEGARWKWEVLSNLLLGGQVSQITSLGGDPIKISICALIGVAISTITGFIFFNRKEIK